MTAGTDAKLRPTQKKTVQTHLASNGGYKSGDKKMSPEAGRKKHDTARERIIAFLSLDPNLDYQPKFIALRIKRHHSAVKTALGRMLAEDVPPIIQTHKGWYRIAWGLEQLKHLENEVRAGLHGIKLEGRTAPRGDKKNTGVSFMSPEKVRYYRKRGTFNDFEFMGRKVTVTWHDMGLIEVWLEASKSPLTFPDFEKYVIYIQGRFSGIVEERKWEVVQWGLNADIYGIEAQGFKAVKLQVFKDTWFQIYRKQQDLIRVEAHSTKVLSMDDVSRLFLTLSACAHEAQNRHETPTEQEAPYHSKPSYEHDPSYG
jgi:hypothetical protein